MKGSSKTDKIGWIKAAWDMLYLTACGIHTQAPDPARVLAMDLKKVYTLSRSQSLNALTYLALEQMTKREDRPEIPDPDRILPAWAESRNKAIRKIMLLDGARAQLFAYLEEKGIWHLPLKGVILTPLYPELGTRQMSDNDTLFDGAYRQEVREWFVDHGYTAESYGEGNHDEYHKAPVYNFEMHVALFNKTAQPQMAEYYQTLKERLKLAPGKAYEYCMTDEDFYLYLLAHMYKHYSNNGTGLRSLLDVHVYNRANDKLDRVYLDQELQKIGLLEFEEQMRLLADKFFDPALKKTNLTEQEWEILQEFLFNHTYGRIENSWRNTVRKTQPEGKPITAGVKFRYILRRLFPSRAHMEKWCELYSPFFHRHKWLMPAARVWRFFKAEKERGMTIKKNFIPYGRCSKIAGIRT